MGISTRRLEKMCRNLRGDFVVQEMTLRELDTVLPQMCNRYKELTGKRYEPPVSSQEISEKLGGDKDLIQMCELFNLGLELTRSEREQAMQIMQAMLDTHPPSDEEDGVSPDASDDYTADE